MVFAAGTAAAAECKGTLYLTIDTGSMSQADNVAAILARHDVRATFFLANEPTLRNDFALDPAWAGYWRARVAEGHAFGSHTWQHGRFRGDTAGGRVTYVVGALRNLRDGDVLMMHLGIRSRQDPFAPMLDPLLAGLKARGFCFDTLGTRAGASAGR